MVDADNDESGSRTLAKIARALDVPMEIFFDPACQDAPGPSEAEEAELLRLFRAIRDPQRRSRCLALIRGLANLPGDGRAS